MSTYDHYDLTFIDASKIILAIGGVQAFFVSFFGLLTASWFSSMFHKKIDDYLVKNKKWSTNEKMEEELQLLQDSRKIEN